MCVVDATHVRLAGDGMRVRQHLALRRPDGLEVLLVGDVFGLGTGNVLDVQVLRRLVNY